jgi:hypothetical protein
MFKIDFMKEEFKEIFKGIFNNLPLNIFCGLGIGFLQFYYGI